MARTSVYRWTRDLHLYFGLFISPIVVVFALSVISLNHAWLPWGGRDEGTQAPTIHAVAIPAEGTNLDLAKAIQRQVEIAGEIDFINRNDDAQTLSFPITSPGRRAMVRVNLQTGTATVEVERSGIWAAMNYLHTMPGPHNVSVRGNWVGMRAWGWAADLTVYLILFLTASGIYLWLALRAERRAGLYFLAAGLASFVVITLAIIG